MNEFFSRDKESRKSMTRCGNCNRLSSEILYLPCGENLCQNCYTRLSDKRLIYGSNEFECPICRYSHKTFKDEGDSRENDLPILRQSNSPVKISQKNIEHEDALYQDYPTTRRSKSPVKISYKNFEYEDDSYKDQLTTRRSKSPVKISPKTFEHEKALYEDQLARRRSNSPVKISHKTIEHEDASYQDYLATRRSSKSPVKISPSTRNIYRTKSANQLRSCLNEIHDHADELNFKLTKRMNRIRDYFKNIRSELDDRADTVIDKIRSQNENLRKELSDYELEEFDKIDPDNELKNLIFESNKFYNSWSEYLERGDLEDDEIERAIQSSIRKLALIEEENNKLSIKTDKITFKFKETKIDPSLNFIGKMNRADNKLMVKSGLKQMRQIDLKPYIKNFNLEWNEIKIECFDDGSYLIVYNDNNSYLNCLVLPSEGGSDGALAMTDQSLCNHFLMRIHRNAIVVFLSTLNPSQYLLKVFDKKFSHFNQLKVDSHVVSLALNDWNIFCLVNEPNKMVMMYKWDLSFVQSFGQREDPNLNFYFSGSTFQFDIIDRKFIMLGDKQIYSIDGYNGKFLDLFQVSASKFVIDSKKNVILLCYGGGNLAKLFYLKSDDMTLANEYNIKDFTSSCTIFIDNTDKILFFDKSRLIIYK